MNFGVVGLILLLFAWIPEEIRTLKSGNLEALDIKFLLLYISGSFILAYHSFRIEDTVFLLLNLIIGILSSIELLIVFWKKYLK